MPNGFSSGPTSTMTKTGWGSLCCSISRAEPRSSGSTEHGRTYSQENSGFGGCVAIGDNLALTCRVRHGVWISQLTKTAAGSLNGGRALFILTSLLTG